MSLTGTTVYGRGPLRTRWMLVGEAPGQTEAERGEPFVGRAGKEQDNYLRQHGLHSRQFYRTNVVKEYIEGNPDPTPELIAKWSPALHEEIRDINPTHILAVGRFASRWLIGREDVDMDTIHGIPHSSPHAPGAIVMPVTHPAAGFYNDDARVSIAYDYMRAVQAIQRKIDTSPAVDEYDGSEEYIDVSGKDLASVLGRHHGDPIAIDTEGFLDGSWNWSIQVCLQPGTGYTLRCDRRDFDTGAAAIQSYCLSRHRPVVIFHNLMHDFSVCRALGVDLFEARVFDTRYAAYALRVEPQGLKALAYRHCGMRMKSYQETVGDAGLQKQLDYLVRIYEDTWPDPEPRVEYANDGTSKLYTPQPVNKRALAIINDITSGKVDKEGSKVDPLKRWRKVDYTLRAEVERRYGRFPVGTLADIPLADALYYAGRDPDATLRLFHRLQPLLRAQNLESLVEAGNDVLPVFEEMQDTGMLASRSYCQSKHDEMDDYMSRLGHRISHRYYGGKPFNPNSGDQVAALMRRRQLVGEKRSKKTKKMSTSKKSIEHLKYVDEAIADVIDWREHAKMKDSFYGPFLEIIGEEEFARIHTNINPYKVVSRRISSSNPNLTAIPVRNDLGLEVRNAISAKEGCLLGSWDLSQIEMRYMAHESQDPLLIKFFKDPKLDVHAETAARIFGLKIIEGTDDKDERYANIDEMKHRYPAKRAAFGIITNIQGPGLLDQLRMAGCEGWTVDRCDELIDNWLGIYRGVKSYMDRAKDEALETGMVRDRWGMIRYLPGVWSDDKMVRAEAERAASSMKIQGGAQGMLQNAIRWAKPIVRGLRDSGYYIRWILTIHDEVILEFEEGLKETVHDIITEALNHHHGVDMLVPVRCSGTIAKTWGEL